MHAQLATWMGEIIMWMMHLHINQKRDDANSSDKH